MLLNKLYGAAKLAVEDMPANYEGTTDRCVVMSPDTVIRDLIKCLRQTTHKREKRIKRVLFIQKYFNDQISNQTVEELNEILYKIISEDEEDFDEPAMSNDEDIAALFKESSYDNNSDEIIFAKRGLDDEFKQPLRQVFNDKCKDIINCDGKLYNVFAAVATIAYRQLLISVEINKCSALREALLRSSKLVFKGGASIGKFLFMANKSLWNSMDDASKSFVEQNFVKGGDNDTSIVFTRTEELQFYTTEEINNGIGSLIYCMHTRVAEIIEQFEIRSIVQDYLSKVVGQTMEYDNHLFTFQQRKASSFAITDRDVKTLELLSIEGNGGELFGTLSYLEFNAPHGRVKFHLARVKAAFKAVLNDGESINCYGECLDISAPCIDTDEVPLMNYLTVNVCALE